MVGYGANYYNSQGCDNTLIGYEAGKGTAILEKSGNIFIGNQAGYYETGSNKLYIENSSSSSPLIGGDFSTNQVYLNGNVGIGNQAPATTLHVTGSVRFSNGSQGIGKVLVSDAGGTGTWTDPATLPSNSWTIAGSDMYANNSGNVGIGTTSPEQKLEVNGSVKMPATTSSSTGVIYKGNVPFIHNYRNTLNIGSNLFLGENSGNFSMTGIYSYSASDNTGAGTATLHSNTSGFANTAVGSYAMTSNNTGYYNTATGLYAMFATSSGIRNTAAGTYSLKENTSGSENVAIGFEANYFNQAGGQNTMIGSGAGKGSSFHNKSGNVFIGYNAGSNETGSNKLYIENSGSSSPLIGGDFSSDKVFLNAQVGVGTASPNASAKLEVNSTTSGFLPPRMTTLQIASIPSPAAGLMVYNTTTNKPNYFNGTLWMEFTGDAAFAQIGAYYDGGIVFYIDGTGLHGLIAAPSDQANSQWGCQGTVVGSSGTAIGTGNSNTNAIIAGCAAADFAARTCYYLVLNDKTDWFLPSKDELNEMYVQRSVIGGFSGIQYWSSSEYDAEKAWKQFVSIYPGTQIADYKGGNYYNVRCVRTF